MKLFDLQPYVTLERIMMRGFHDWKKGKLVIPSEDYPPSFELAAREAAGAANKAISEMMGEVR